MQARQAICAEMKVNQILIGYFPSNCGIFPDISALSILID
jgi:hypothetical protein